MSRFGRFLIVLLLLSLLTGACSLVAPPHPRVDETPAFAFAVLADPRSGQKLWRHALAEIRDRNMNPVPAFKPAEVILVVGDIDPLEKRYKDFQEIFAETGNEPLLLPVMGNHDIYDRPYMRDTVLPDVDYVTQRDSEYVNYFADWRNVRLIAVDAYSDLGRQGAINDEGRAWVEEAIESAPEDIDHIFVAFHEPAFPRYRHLHDSFNLNSEARDSFWDMLVAHKERVRAVFVGHTHTYSRIRVLDPASAAANDPEVFPDEDGGIYQVDAGAAGNSSDNTLVLVQIDDDDVSYRVLQAGWRDDHPFNVIDEWQSEPVTETVVSLGG